MKRVLLFLLTFVVASAAHSQSVDFTMCESKTNASFRGLSVVDNAVAWVSGSKGTIGVTTDGGRNWKFITVQGYEQLDFRSIYAFDEKKAVIANAGSPANILLTTDGGDNWKNVYANNDSAAFIDGIDFFDSKNGLVYGDPINKKMLLLRTTDSGLTWKEMQDASRPVLEEGEASFAASGTNIRCVSKNRVIIATGGRKSRLWVSDNMGARWRSIDVPIVQGESATGIFSVARTSGSLHVVGGNYLVDSLRTDHVFYSVDEGQWWKKPANPTRGYRECVEFLDHQVLIATGPSGTDASFDEGKNWIAVSDEKYFHVVRKARKGSLVIIAGGKGKIGIISLR
jgi:photosystem II stability/assembly factor-like uncharacterized protein